MASTAVQRAEQKKARAAADARAQRQAEITEAAETLLALYGGISGANLRRVQRAGWDVVSGMQGISAAEQEEIAPAHTRMRALEALLVVERGLAQGFTEVR